MKEMNLESAQEIIARLVDGRDLEMGEAVKSSGPLLPLSV